MSNMVVRLRDIAIEDKQIVLPRSKEALSRPYLGLEQIESTTGRILKYETSSAEGKSSTFAFDTSHILYGKLRPYLNKVAIPERVGRCSTEIIPLLPQGVDREFLAFLLRTERVVSAAMSEKTGSRMPRADMDALLDVEVFIPESEAQQRIIADRLRGQLAAVEQARQAAQARKAEFSKLRARLTAQAFDRIHEAHPAFALRDVAKIASGITLGRRTKETNLTSVPYLRVANVQDSQLDLSEIKVIEATPTEIGKWRLREGDLLLTEGGDLDKLGRGTFWRNELPLCIHQNHIFRVRFSLDRYDPSFVALQINSGYGKEYFLAHAKKTTGIATINQQVLGSFPLVSPPLQEQRRIAAQLSFQLAIIDKAEAASSGELAEIERLPARLLAQVFGEH